MDIKRPFFPPCRNWPICTLYHTTHTMPSTIPTMHKYTFSINICNIYFSMIWSAIKNTTCCDSSIHLCSLIHSGKFQRLSAFPIHSIFFLQGHLKTSSSFFLLGLDSIWSHSLLVWRRLKLSALDQSLHFLMTREVFLFPHTHCLSLVLTCTRNCHAWGVYFPIHPSSRQCTDTFFCYL